MAQKQLQVPGGPYLNQTTNKQMQVPAGPYVNQTGIVFNPFWALHSTLVIGA